MRVTVWKCRRTGALFEETIEYRRHLARLAAQRQFKRNRIARLAKADEVLAGRENLKSFEEIAAWLEANGRLLVERQLVRSGFRKRNQTKIPKDFCFKEVEFREMRWNDKCSNSHSAPKGKKTNWDRKTGPTGYPGFRGHIHFYLTGYPDFSSKILDDTAIHSGSGGGGDRLSFSVTLFAEEWPALTFHEAFENDSTSRSGMALVDGEIA